MGVRNYLIEGVSGAGKTTVADELQRRGHQVVHGDRELAYRGDPQTGQPATAPSDPPTVEWLSDHWIWDVEKVRAYTADHTEPLTFFCGGSRNHAKFIDLLDGVFILEVDRETMIRRIEDRVARDPTEFGGKPGERDLIVRLHANQTDVPKAGVRIDATAPIATIVDAILARCAEAGRADASSA